MVKLIATSCGDGKCFISPTLSLPYIDKIFSESFKISSAEAFGGSFVNTRPIALETSSFV